MSGKMDGTAYHYVVDRGVYYDTSTKGRMNHRHHSYRAEVRCDGLRIRKRFASHSAARAWIDYMCGKASDGVRLCRLPKRTYGRPID